MKILMIGYGKMGRAIEQAAESRGHQMPYKITHQNANELSQIKKEQVDVAIEFTQPNSAVANIQTCLTKGIPIVTGTTGWHEQLKAVKADCEAHEGAVFFSANFSIGVNLFFKLNQRLAQLMNRHPTYKASIEEWHHTEKRDSPSGTAVKLAQDLIDQYPSLERWHLDNGTNQEKSLPVKAYREIGIFGIHEVSYQSTIDTISIKHEAHSREGFAQGAVIAAEWLLDKKGFFGMDDFLK